MTESGSQPVAWITGAGGLIGNYLGRSPFAPGGWRLVPLGRGDLDLTDRGAVERRFRAERPQLVIHCAAISKTTECEQQPALAWCVNVDVPAQLAELCSENRLVFLSTDLVFDGRKGHYVETDTVNPLGVYAETKVAAEQRVLACPRHVVVRTSLNAGRSPTGDRSFNEQLRRAWQEGRMLRLFTDEFRCPIPAEVTARAIWELALKSAAGLYHLAGAERLSRHEMGRLLAEQCREVNPQIEPASITEYRGAPRSPDCSLNCAKVQAELSFALPRFSEWIAAHLVY